MEAGTDPHRRLTSCSLPLSLKRDPHARIPCRGRRPRRPATPCFPPCLPSKHFRFSCISSPAMGEFHMPSAYFTREAHFTRRRRISLRRNTRRHGRPVTPFLSPYFKRDSHARIPCRGRRPRRPATPCFPPCLPSKHFRFSCISSPAMGEFHMPSAYFTREAHFTRRRRISLRRNTRRHERPVRRAKSSARNAGSPHSHANLYFVRVCEDFVH